MTRMQYLSAALVASVVGAVLWLVPALAQACGAFVPTDEYFSEYGDSSPLSELVGHDQEQMVYVVDDGRLTVYQGRSFTGNRDQSPIDALLEAEDHREFAWLLPVPGKPEIEMTPTEIFERLDEATAPSFVLEDESDGDCPAEVRTLVKTETVDGRFGGGAPATLGTLSPGESLGAGSPDAPAVGVVDSGEVGPFEHATITTREDLDRPGERALEWLEEHGYSLEAVDDALLDSYLGKGLNLLAFRLRADADTGEIRPVAITVDADQALSPIRLGAMGAAEQTGIQVWVAAPHRVVPETYARVQPNQALIDWSDGGSNYDAVVAEAVREAGGQAFAVDATMDMSELGHFLLSSETLQRWEEIRGSSAGSAEERRAHFTELARFLHDLDEDASIDISSEYEAFQQDYFPIPDDGLRGTVVRRARKRSVQLREASLADGSRQKFLAPVAQALDGDFYDHVVDCHFEKEEGAREQRSMGRIGGLKIALTVDKGSPDQVEAEVDSSTLGEEANACVLEHARSVFKSSLDPIHSAVRSGEQERISVGVSITIANERVPISHASITDRGRMVTDDDLAELDWQALMDAIDEEVIAPRRNAQQRLASVDKLTRLSTTMSPEAMTRDAYFIEDPEAEPTPRRRRATRTVLCGEDSEQQKEVTQRGEKRIYTTRDWRFEPPYGTAVEGHDDKWPVDMDDEAAAYDVVERRSDRGGTEPEHARWGGEREGMWVWIVGLVVGLMLPAIGVAVIARRR